MISWSIFVFKSVAKDCIYYPVFSWVIRDFMIKNDLYLCFCLIAGNEIYLLKLCPTTKISNTSEICHKELHLESIPWSKQF